MRHERSYKQIHGGDENDQKERKPADLGKNGGSVRGHVSMLRGAGKPFRQERRMNEPPSVMRSSRPFEGRVFTVRSDEIRYADGSEHRVDVVEHGASLAIVATPAPNEIVLVRQYRHPAGSLLWELPAGMAEPGETPLDGARRELLEETGYRAGRIRSIGSVWTTPGFCSEVMHFFHADELVAGEPAFDDDERIEVATFTWEAARRLVAEGTGDAKTVLALFWLQGGRDKI
jgi:ADP-ribose pyrophosphatase